MKYKSQIQTIQSRNVHCKVTIGKVKYRNKKIQNLNPDDEEHSKDENEDKGFVCSCGG